MNAQMLQIRKAKKEYSSINHCDLVYDIDLELWKCP